MTPEQGIYILSLSEAGAPPHFSLLFFLLKAEKLPNVTTGERASNERIQQSQTPHVGSQKHDEINQIQSSVTGSVLCDEAAVLWSRKPVWVRPPGAQNRAGGVSVILTA